MAGSYLGAIAGAKVLGFIGAFFFGVGAIPGAVIGGLLGGYFGGEYGEEGAEYLYNEITE